MGDPRGEGGRHEMLGAVDHQFGARSLEAGGAVLSQQVWLKL
jgi:hypothetical protein